jgi:phage tail protein X
MVKTPAPVPPGIFAPPTPIVSPPPAVSTVAVPLGARIYVSTQGDWWDVIAMKVYGMKRGNESLMYRLIESNYVLRDVSLFPAGVAVIVPEVPVATEIPLVPWKSATIITS